MGSRIKKIMPVKKIKKFVLEKHVPTQKYNINWICYFCYTIYVFDWNNMSASVFIHKEFEVLVFIKKTHLFEIKVFENYQFSQLFCAFYS